MTDIVFRPSSADRIIACSGSVQLSIGLPNTSSPEAIEGSGAHKLLEHCMQGAGPAHRWIGQTVETDHGEKVPVTAEMIEAVNMVLDEVAARTVDGAIVKSEHFMSLQPMDATDPLLKQNGGTADILILNYAAATINILDLKYGKGKPVRGDSPQLKNYALLALVNYPHPTGWQKVETVIIQPRLPNEDHWVKPFSFHPAEIWAFAGQLYAAMVAAQKPNAPLVPGDHCFWCLARRHARCPALAAQAVDISRNAFLAKPLITAAEPMPKIIGANAAGTALPDISKFTLPEIGEILSRRNIWDAWIKGIEQHAVTMLEQGAHIPGWKLVRRSKNRQWKEHDDAGAAIDTPKLLAALGIAWADIYTEPKLKSPAQIEKLLPKSSRDSISVLVERPLGDVTLVSDDDKRDSVKPVFTSLLTAT